MRKTRYLVMAAILTIALVTPGEAAAQTKAIAKYDSIWDRVLIGAAVGLVVGLVAAPPMFCSRNDPECNAIVRIAIGLPAIGVGIGVGALADGLHHQRAPGPVSLGSSKSVNLSFRF